MPKISFKALNQAICKASTSCKYSGTELGMMTSQDPEAAELLADGSTSFFGMDQSLHALEKATEGNGADQDKLEIDEAAQAKLDSKAAELAKASDELRKSTESTIQTLTGHVSVQDAAQAASTINTAYDKAVADVGKIFLGDEESGKLIEEWTKQKIGPGLFNAGSVIKNGSVQGMAGVAYFFSGIDAFKGDWDNPVQAVENIEKGVNSIIKGVSAAATCCQTLADGLGYMGESILANDKLRNPLIQGAGHMLDKVGGLADGPVLTRLANTQGLSAAVSILGGFTGTGMHALGVDGAEAYDATVPNIAYSPYDPLTGGVRGEDQSLSDGPENAEKQQTSSAEGEDDKVLGEAEYVSELKFILEGFPNENNSECIIAGVEYLVSGYSLVQRMLSPVTLSFSMMKKQTAEEVTNDVTYEVCRQLIGKEIKVQVTTKSFGETEDVRTNQFSFEGLVTGISASRGVAGSPSVDIVASTFDYLLDTAPNCRSFENKTLQEIVTEIVSPYKQLKHKINPRYKKPIPYLVQYNQSDYVFLTSLARRFGEWMYNDGVAFVFGEIVPPSDKVVRMRYPSGNIFGYGINMQLRDFNFMHVTTDFYNYGNGVHCKTADDEANRELHRLNQSAFMASRQSYRTHSIYYPGAGGAFDSGESECPDSVLDFSVKVEARGKKAQMFVTNGSSKVSNLFLGQNFEIVDGVENRSGEKEEIKQHPLMVISVTHTFDLEQVYCNMFEAIPSSCDYPPYSTADVFAQACPQRATVVDNQDPLRLGRVRVQFPWQKVWSDGDVQMQTPWIRIAQPYGGMSKGVQFIPEVGEEVMIGFEMDNVERPYVMGSLFNGGSGLPDEEWGARAAQGSTANNIKAIRTRNGHTIQFCDNGDGGDIQIYDYNKNNYLIALSTDGQYIRIEAKGDIQIVAGNDVSITAKKNITLKAGENVTVDSGQDTDIHAGANMSVAAENNMQQEATNVFVKASNDIAQDSANSHVVSTKVLQEKAADRASFDGGSLLEITASSVKVR